MNGRHPPTPGRRPGARVGSVRGVAPVAPLPPPRPSPTRHASPSQSPECAKVRVSQVRKSSCLLTAGTRGARAPRNRSTSPPSQPKPLGTPPFSTAHPAWNAGFSRHPRRESAAEPHHLTPFTAKPLGTPPFSTAHPAWNAGFSRHPRRESAAEPQHLTPFTAKTPRHPTLQYSPPGLERRLQPAPAARERGGTAAPHPLHSPNPRNPTRQYSPPGLERRLQPAPAARERRGTAPSHFPSQRHRLGAPGSRATRNARRLGRQFGADRKYNKRGLGTAWPVCSNLAGAAARCGLLPVARNELRQSQVRDLHRLSFGVSQDAPARPAHGCLSGLLAAMGGVSGHRGGSARDAPEEPFLRGIGRAVRRNPRAVPDVETADARAGVPLGAPPPVERLLGRR